MGVPGNGVNPNGNGAAVKSGGPERCPRRIVLLADGEDSAVREVLHELRGDAVSGDRLHAELQRLAAERPGRLLAAEWLGKLGWTRFLWCRK